MGIVSNSKELGYERKEVLLCHFRLHRHDNTGQETQKFWRLWFQNAPYRSVRHPVPELLAREVGWHYLRERVDSTDLTICYIASIITSSQNETIITKDGYIYSNNRFPGAPRVEE